MCPQTNLRIIPISVSRRLQKVPQPTAMWIVVSFSQVLHCFIFLLFAVIFFSFFALQVSFSFVVRITCNLHRDLNLIGLCVPAYWRDFNESILKRRVYLE